MTGRSRVSSAARRILDRGILCHLAVAAAQGPHLTPVVYVLDGGRLWLTTSRSSVKARALRTSPSVAGLVRADGGAVIFRGTARTYDWFDPFTWPAAAAAGPGLLRAATRFTLKNARFFAGYAVDAARVPLAWTPPGRVFVRIELTAGRVLDPAGRVLDPHGDADGWGHWARHPVRYGRAFDPRRQAGIARAPGVILRDIGDSGRGAIALDGAAGLTVLPVDWARVGEGGAFEATTSRGLFELTGAGSGATGALTVDRASPWRAADMTGVMLQGWVDAYAPGETRRGVRAIRDHIGRIVEAGDEAVLLRPRPARAVWWRGWTSGTVAATGTSRNRHNGRRP